MKEINDKRIKFLFKLLDDIDTAYDMFKPETREIDKYILDLCNKRFEILKSDGYNLFEIEIK